VEEWPQPILLLDDGSRLVAAADWSGGASVRLEGDEAIVRSELFGEVRLPRSVVRGLVFAQRSHPRERDALIQRIWDAPSNRRFPPGSGGGDTVYLSNGDRLAGDVKELAGGSLTVATRSGAAKLPLSRVEAVALASSRQPSAVSRQPRVIVGLRDGSVVYADAVRGDEENLVVELTEGVQLSGGGVDDVVALQSLGGRFVYLSDLVPAAYRHVPYLELEWPYERDRNVTGGPLAVGGKQYLKGVGMHSASRLTYGLDGKYKRFDAAVAVDDAAEAGGSVTFGVYLLREGEWQEAYKSDVVRGDDAPLPVSIDVSGARGLTLTVDYADRGDELDRADWLDARLVKE
jgi:hypothetical protein